MIISKSFYALEYEIEKNNKTNSRIEYNTYVQIIILLLSNQKLLILFELKHKKEPNDNYVKNINIKDFLLRVYLRLI